MKHPVITLRLHSGGVTIDGQEVQMKLPEGCSGVLFAFESKKAARKYWGNDVDFIRFEQLKKEFTDEEKSRNNP